MSSRATDDARELWLLDSGVDDGAAVDLTTPSSSCVDSIKQAYLSTLSWLLLFHVGDLGIQLRPAPLPCTQNRNIHYDKLMALLEASSLQHLPVRFSLLLVHYEFLHLARLCTRWPVAVFLCQRQPHERHRPPSLSSHQDCRHPWMWRLQTCSSFGTATMRQIGSIHVHSTRTVTCPVNVRLQWSTSWTIECVDLNDVQNKYFVVSSMKYLFENVASQNIVDFIKEIHFISNFTVTCPVSITTVHSGSGSEHIQSRK